MTGERLPLEGAAATLLITLYLRARDARSAHPVLADRFAGPALDRLDIDLSRFARLRGDTRTIASRGLQLDRWTAQFLHDHPAAQVLHLGCGLDSRPLRVTRPPTSRWVDLDLPEVIALRRQVYDLPEDVDCVAASAADPRWWDQVAAESPTLLLAEGLLMYLPPADVHALMERVQARVSGGQVAFDAVAPWTVGASNRTRELRQVGARFRWAFRRGRFEARHPLLRPLDDISVLSLAQAASPGRLLRGGYAALGLLPPMRDAMRLHRYAFGSGLWAVDTGRGSPTCRRER